MNGWTFAPSVKNTVWHRLDGVASSRWTYDMPDEWGTIAMLRWGKFVHGENLLSESGGAKKGTFSPSLQTSSNEESWSDTSVESMWRLKMSMKKGSPITFIDALKACRAPAMRPGSLEMAGRNE